MDSGEGRFGKLWLVEIDSLEALLDFVRQHAEPVVIKELRDQTTHSFELEIYDDYRE